MNTMTITLAKYVKNGPTSTAHSGINATIDGTECFVPLAPGNRHYDEIMRQVSNGTLEILPANAGEAGTLVIQEADAEIP